MFKTIKKQQKLKELKIFAKNYMKSKKKIICDFPDRNWQTNRLMKQSTK